jgi:hypothetical protein
LKTSKILSEIISIPQYSNKPKNKKFSNFLGSKIQDEELWPSCHKDIQALEVDSESKKINSEKCIGCLNCVTNNLEFSQLDEEMKNELWDIFFEDKNWKKEKIDTSNILNGNRIELPNFNTFERKYSTFEDYTSTNEVEHISLWGLSTLRFLSSKKPTVGREIEIYQSEFPRDGRLDICFKCNNSILIVEAKTDFISLVTENRFVQQIPKYQIECKKIINDEFYSENLNLNLLLLVGGNETDLFPPTHSDCTSTVGNKAQKFYDDIDKNKIKFLSANALWILGMNAIFSNKKICWDLLFPKIFSDNNVVGLVTSGIVIKKNNGFEINPIPRQTIEDASINY